MGNAIETGGVMTTCLPAASPCRQAYIDRLGSAGLVLCRHVYRWWLSRDFLRCSHHFVSQQESMPFFVYAVKALDARGFGRWIELQSHAIRAGKVALAVVSTQTVVAGCDPEVAMHRSRGLFRHLPQCCFQSDRLTYVSCRLLSKLSML